MAKIVSLFRGARHAPLFTIPMLLIGGAIAEFQIDVKSKNRQNFLIGLFFLLMIASFIETIFLKAKLGDSA